jgi:hypothetical protein
MGHTSLVSHEGGKVDGLGFIVLGEGSDTAAVVSCPASRQESKGARSGALILSVRHKYLYYLIIINHNLIFLYIINILI